MDHIQGVERVSWNPGRTLKQIIRAFGHLTSRVHSSAGLNMSFRTCLILASAFGFFAVMLGAFGAHGLSGQDGYLQRKYADTEPKEIAGMHVTAPWKYYQDFQTGVRYHMWHTLALLAIGLWKRQSESRSLSVAAWAFTIGIVLFSGALYLLVIGGPRFAGIPWGAIAPFGGTALLVGWIAALTAACQQTSPAAESPAET